jgi:hypothetical protein
MTAWLVSGKVGSAFSVISSALVTSGSSAAPYPDSVLLLTETASSAASYLADPFDVTESLGGPVFGIGMEEPSEEVEDSESVGIVLGLPRFSTLRRLRAMLVSGLLLLFVRRTLLLDKSHLRAGSDRLPSAPANSTVKVTLPSSSFQEIDVPVAFSRKRDSVSAKSKEADDVVEATFECSIVGE